MKQRKIPAAKWDLIILEFIDAKQDAAKELEEKLKKIRQVKVKTMEF